ncbi:MAG: hypothetical protein AMJ53_03575 [Gammaproteobacteria bacterium SG8_11]|nr:MAG: hypothetical protein AMJ53_03575 [Gammaproteobacteria bacterium SG8_11]
MKAIEKYLSTLLIVALVALSASAMAKESKEASKEKSKNEAKELSGISIVGNKEAPKSLFIVPWKSSELGVETGLASSLLNEKLKPVDKDVFARELDFYSITAVE